MNKTIGFDELDIDGHYLKSCSTRWLPMDTEKNYKAKGNLYLPESFSYDMNSNGYRCDEFDNIEDHKLRVLFVGCSHTFGIGLPVDDVWPKVIIDRLETTLNTKIPYWNIALGGKSLDYCSRALWKIIPIIKPHIVLMLCPPFGRREVVTEKHGLVDFLINNDQGPVPFDDMEFNLTDGNQLYNVNRNLILISQLCKASGSIFRWNHSLSITNWNTTQLILDNISKEAKDQRWHTKFHHLDFARDSAHYGPSSHKSFAENSVNELLSVFTTLKAANSC